jgi:hypothetical protein
VIQTVALVASLPRSLAIDPREVLPPEGLFISRLNLRHAIKKFDFLRMKN